MLSMRENWLLVGWACAKIGVDSVCDEIVSSYAQQAMKLFPRMLSQCMKSTAKSQIKSNFRVLIIKISKNSQGFHFMGPKWTFDKKNFIPPNKKLVPCMLFIARSLWKCSNIKILTKIEIKDSNLFLNCDQGHIRFWFRQKEFKTISHLCTFNCLFKTILL